jgi:hypothetical protein
MLKATTKHKKSQFDGDSPRVCWRMWLLLLVLFTVMTNAFINTSASSAARLPAQKASIAGMHTVCEQYDAFLVDAWGVLHNGHTLYPRYNITRVQSRNVVLSAKQTQKASPELSLCVLLHVLHGMYCRAVECLQELASHNKQMILLSNSGRTKDSVLAHLK